MEVKSCGWEVERQEVVCVCVLGLWGRMGLPPAYSFSDTFLPPPWTALGKPPESISQVGRALAAHGLMQCVFLQRWACKRSLAAQCEHYFLSSMTSHSPSHLGAPFLSFVGFMALIYSPGCSRQWNVLRALKVWEAKS